MNKVNAVLSRDYGARSTTSCLYIFEGDKVLFNCVMIEPPKFVVPMRINSPNIDCIPGEMTYTVKKHYSPSKGECFQVMDVPDRTWVLWHVGNYATGRKIDTEGCLLPGMRFEDINRDGNIDVADSTKAMDMLLAILPDEFKLHIIN